MARYYFDHEDGEVIRDEVGVELPDDHAVCEAAIRIFARALEANAGAFWRTAMNGLNVRDAQGLCVLRLDLTGTLSPATRARLGPVADAVRRAP
jgi:hypothetical protein